MRKVLLSIFFATIILALPITGVSEGKHALSRIEKLERSDVFIQKLE